MLAVLELLGWCVLVSLIVGWVMCNCCPIVLKPIQHFLIKPILQSSSSQTQNQDEENFVPNNGEILPSAPIMAQNQFEEPPPPYPGPPDNPPPYPGLPQDQLIDDNG